MIRRPHGLTIWLRWRCCQCKLDFAKQSNTTLNCISVCHKSFHHEHMMSQHTRMTMANSQRKSNSEYSHNRDRCAIKHQPGRRRIGVYAIYTFTPTTCIHNTRKQPIARRLISTAKSCLQYAVHISTYVVI